MTQVRAKKSLGQHFLTDLSIARRIADTIGEYPALPVIEVGPGMGVLTQYLLADGRDVTVVELDSESVQYLRQHYPDRLQGDRIVEADFLKLDIDKLVKGDSQYCVIGNYPYNISSQIFFKVLEHRDRIACCSGMLQKEVAERLAAPAGTKARGILSVLLQVWYDVEYLFTVPPGVFNPPPKVQSGVIICRRNGVTDPGCDPALLKTVVKTTFNQRRKTIRNSIRGILPPGVTPPESLLWAMRPEQLTVAQFVELTNTVAGMRAAQTTDTVTE